MAKNRIPNPLQRRHLLEQDLAPPRALAVAEAYLAEGRSAESLDFLAKAGAEDKLRALEEEAIASGDVFLLREVAQRLGEEPDADRWRRLAEAAEACGKEVYAHEARRMAEARAGAPQV
jgi:hypothetical protein